MASAEQIDDFQDIFLENISILKNFSYDVSLSDSGDLEINRNCSEEFLLYARAMETSNHSSLTFEEKQNLEQVKHALYFVVIPAVCVFGFFGNILNIVVFSKKKMCKTLDEIEYCTTIFLIALAISDMMFCFSTFPHVFETRTDGIYGKKDFLLFYKLYAAFAINTFIMSSTLLTVITAIMRYTAICHPFHSRQFISFKKTIAAIVLVFTFSAAFNAPQLWRHAIEDVKCQGPEQFVRLENGKPFRDEKFVYIQRLLLAIVGNFIPLILLLYCNIRLVKALHESQQLRLLHSRDNSGCLSAHRRINITLITIIILFFVLVAPSEISKFISYISHSHSGKGSYTYYLVSMITNTLQCINFSVNFVLYYVIIAPFRRTIHEFVCVLMSRKGTRESTNSQQKQTCIVLTLKEQRRNLI
ncbi:FMRFamide receptor-like [Mya arenaria]|uniref:FMRFamide receptor-like n=1 Tax=Mya arenaria TaxID=6604 RepID=UPI0022E401B6|nr:FMRFamide receptor-like [Mya arenaria]